MTQKFKIWLNIVTFVGISFIIYFARHDIVSAFQKMAHLNLWVLSLIIPAQLLAYYSLSKVYATYFRAIGIKHLSVKQLFPAVIELNFVNHVLPSGGVSGFSYLTFRLKRHDISIAKSTLAQLTRYVLAFVTFLVLLFIAIPMLAIEGKVNSIIIFVATSLTLCIIFGVGVLVYVVESRIRINKFAIFLTKMVNGVVKFFTGKKSNVANTEAIETYFNELHEDYILFRSDLSKMTPVLAWAFITNVVEVGQIYIAFVAHGSWINPGALIIAYAVATIAGLIAILPGGLGVYEPLMVAVLFASGIPNDLAVSATLVFRVILLTFTIVVGYVLYHRALKLYGTDNTIGH